MSQRNMNKTMSKKKGENKGRLKKTNSTKGKRQYNAKQKKVKRGGKKH
jgi:hypothetical protein